MATACAPATRPTCACAAYCATRSACGCCVICHWPSDMPWRVNCARKASQKAASIIDVTPSEVPRLMTKYGVRTLIHGHTHRPASHTLEVNGQRAQRIVLGDWDQQGWALQVDEN